MIPIINYVTSIFYHIVNILDVKPFPDFNVSILQIILCCFVLKYIFKFFFGGMHEFDISTNWMNSVISREISNSQRISTLVKNSKHDDIPKERKIKKASKREQEKMRKILQELDVD